MDYLCRPGVGNLGGEDGFGCNAGLLRSIHDGKERTLFMDYPRRWGFTSDELCTGTFPPNRSELAAAVVQNWLSFGLMEEVFDTSVPEADFTTASASGQLLLSMDNLHKYGGA